MEQLGEGSACTVCLWVPPSLLSADPSRATFIPYTF